MKNNKSWAQITYGYAYGRERLEAWGTGMPRDESIPCDIRKAVDDSCQNKEQVFTGWISEERRKRFYAILYRILTTSEGIPF